MLDWIDHPHAGYVLAAYVIAAVVLAGIGIVSWRENKQRDREWRAIMPRRMDSE